MTSLKALAERARDARNGILDHPVGSDIWRELCARSRLAHEHFSVAASPAAILALLAENERLTAEGLWLRRLVQWCRMRLRREGYGETLDRYLAEGVTEPDFTPVVLSEDKP